MKGTDLPRAQWYWKSSYDPWLTNGIEEWTKYSDIESEIIEEAFNGKNATTKGGTDLLQRSKYPDEQEVLLPPGTTFTIIE
ncbi:unnamed protein product, partial [Didymodactylos carnosus]